MEGQSLQGGRGAAGANELDDMLSMIFSTTESAKFICREIYNFFIYYKIDAEIETNIITPLAQVFRDSGYDIKSVLSVLFKSEHFYNLAYSSACIIKSPIDFLLGLIREFEVAYCLILRTMHQIMPSGTCCLEGQRTCRAGNPGHSTRRRLVCLLPGSGFHELWINSVTYTGRNAYTDLMISTGDMMSMVNLVIDPIAFAKKLPGPQDPNLLIGAPWIFCTGYPYPMIRNLYKANHFAVRPDQ